ncbi:response regulator [Paenibacillus filicis]|uniref:Transcriptional regulatory protein n=1 Tax=Paenibacillus gyeongsangnamensis TaxID=3388067 RepID=A0ABT4QDZ7_9BACL|nr:response regulator [Paenibacillus filicis]MCZ8515017.1 response regulator [Paenibacillus filicis]
MTHSSIRTVIVEDDFMIAKMHGKYIDSQDGYQLVGIVHNYEQALAHVSESKPDLLLLDVYLPDRSGIELLRTIRSNNLPCDIILITASKEHEIVEEGLRLGAIDYLINPFALSQLQNTLNQYALFKKRLSSSTQLNQEFLHELMKLRAPKRSAAPSQKGIDERTLDRIKKCLADQTEYLSADEIAHLAGVGLTTIRNYLTFLAKENIVEELLQYGAIGRPQRLYRLK